MFSYYATALHEQYINNKETFCKNIIDLIFSIRTPTKKKKKKFPTTFPRWNIIICTKFNVP